jgi:hypothetical protein
LCISWTNKRFDNIKTHGATVKINEEEAFSVFSEILECKYFNAIKSVLMHPEGKELNQSIQKNHKHNYVA